MSSPAAPAARSRLWAPHGVPLASAVVILLLMLCAAVGARWLEPQWLPVPPAADLSSAVPIAFGPWSAAPDALEQVSLATDDDVVEGYDQVLMRTYVNAQGDAVMLALAFVASQRQEAKIHRPEACYVSQGFVVRALHPATFDRVAATRAVTGQRMLVRAGARSEAVSYWIRVGELFSDNAWLTRWHILAEGVHGRQTDGMLVRASQLVPAQASGDELEHAYRVQETFLADLVQATAAPARELLAR